MSVAVFPDGRRVVSASGDKTLKLWGGGGGAASKVTLAMPKYWDEVKDALVERVATLKADFGVVVK